jgi:hypothetical protein
VHQPCVVDGVADSSHFWLELVVWTTGQTFKLAARQSSLSGAIIDIDCEGQSAVLLVQPRSSAPFSEV